MIPSFALFANRNCLGLRELATIPMLAIVAPLLFGLAVVGLASDVFAQDGPAAQAAIWPADAAYRAATLAEDLTFPADAEAAAKLTSPRMALLKPAGEGPFPAIVIMHQCSGPKEAVVSWAHRAVARHYAVLLVDSLGPRGVLSVCYGPEAGVNLFRRGQLPLFGPWFPMVSVLEPSSKFS
jgi:hypothetical protein